MTKKEKFINPIVWCQCITNNKDTMLPSHCFYVALVYAKVHHMFTGLCFCGPLAFKIVQLMKLIFLNTYQTHIREFIKNIQCEICLLKIWEKMHLSKRFHSDLWIIHYLQSQSAFSVHQSCSVFTEQLFPQIWASLSLYANILVPPAISSSFLTSFCV